MDKPDVYASDDYLAFVASMREQPDDDVIRLACADFLQEHGDEARAEFIRVQVELARGPDGIDCEIVSGRFSRGMSDRDFLYDCYPASPAPPRPPIGERVVARVFGEPQRTWSRFEGTCCAWLTNAEERRGFTLTRVKASEWKPELTAREKAFHKGPAATEADRRLESHGDAAGGYLVPRAFTHAPTVLWFPGGFLDYVSFGPVYRRGFVESLTCLARGWLDNAEAILARLPVTAVRLTTMPEIETDERDDKSSLLAARIVGREVISTFNYMTDRDRRDWAKRLLEAEWPGITFELPP